VSGRAARVARRGWTYPTSSRASPQNDPRKAAEIVTEDLTLPASLGRVCPRLCEERCHQCEADEALSIRNLHRFAADSQRISVTPYLPKNAEPTGKSAAIVGAGPAGLTAAYHLLRRGHGAVVFDAHPKPGGMLRYGIPAFRLPHSVLDAEIKRIRDGALNSVWARNSAGTITLDDLRRDFDAVFLAVGAQGSRGLGCPGEELALPALDFLAKITDGPGARRGHARRHRGRRQHRHGRQPLRAAAGAASVRVLYRRTRREMPCLLEEIEAAEAEGVQVEYLVAPTQLEPKNGRLALTCQRMELGPPDESGRARPVPVDGSEFVVEATCVIAAIGQAVDFNPNHAADLTFSPWGISADPHTLATNLPGVFAGGDAVTGPDLAVRAVAAGKLAAASIDQYLNDQNVIGTPEAVNVIMGKLTEAELAEFLRGIDAVPRSPMPHLEMQRRRTSFEEVDLGFTPETALRESQRCLGCGCGKAIPCRLRQFATEYGVDPQRFVGQRRPFARDTSHPDIIFEPGKCILCGACVQVALEAGETTGLSLFGRGFQATVSVPFRLPMAEALKQSAQRAAEVCPTGAIMLKSGGCAGCRCS
jgi:formate dehydrogenase major subunit